MSAQGRAEIRQIAEKMIHAFLRSAEERHGGKSVTIGDLRAGLPDFATSPGFSALMREAHVKLLEAGAAELLRQQRGDPFQRLLVHPLTGEFEKGTLSRDILPSYFSFLHLVLGDEKDAQTAVCVDLMAMLRDPDPLMFSWDDFYDHPQAKASLWSVLLRIAEAFKRFDVRRDWFIGLMQNRPQSVSLGALAFVPRPHGDDGHPPFGPMEFNRLFAALYHQLRYLTGADLVLFSKLAGGAPEMVLARFFADLKASGVAL